MRERREMAVRSHMQSSDVFPGARRVERLLVGGAGGPERRAWERLFHATEARVDEALERLAALERQVRALDRAVGTGARRPAVDGYVVFAAAPDGYRIEEARGAPPARGAEIETAAGRLRVMRLGASPFPDDARPCVFAEPG